MRARAWLCGNVVICSEQDDNNNVDNVLLPLVNLLTTEQLAKQEDSNALSDTANEQKERMSKLCETLKIDESNLMADEVNLIIKRTGYRVFRYFCFKFYGVGNYRFGYPLN